MSQALKYQRSIAEEFNAIKDRVRFFIKDRHWGEDGRYKEIILMNYLRKILPGNVSVGTGFVKNEYGELTSQIDILVYNNQYPKLFSEGDFVVLMPESILGIIEVKSKSRQEILAGNRGAIDKAEENGKIIGSKKIFNGIFAYENNVKFNCGFINSRLGEQLRNSHGYVNHLALGSNNFIRYWDEANQSVNSRNRYSAYRLTSENNNSVNNSTNNGYAFGYFISNLLETVYRLLSPDALSSQYFEFLYPIRGTKEIYKIENGDIYLNEHFNQTYLIDEDFDANELEFEEIWNNVISNEGETFKTKTGVQFTYRIQNGRLISSRAKSKLSKDDFKKAFEMMPLNGPS